MAEWLACQTLNHKVVGSSPEPVGSSKNHPAWAMGDDNGALTWP